MNNNIIEIINLIIDNVFVKILPFIFSIGIPAFTNIKNRKDTKKLVNTRLEHLEKQVREHLRGYSDEEQELIDKTLKEVFSKPSMRW